MKNKFLMFILGSVFVFYTLPVFAACDCSSYEIANKLKYASSSDLQSIFNSMAGSSRSNSLSSSARNEIDTMIKDYLERNNVIQNYVQKNCYVQNSRIICN